MSDAAAVAGFDFSSYGVIVNAAAYTAVDAAETAAGRRDAWATNVSGGRCPGPRRARAPDDPGPRLVRLRLRRHRGGPREDEPFSPLGVYGQTKAAGDAVVATVPRHYLLRTSWVIGEGKNFVATMASLADRGIAPSVVADQFGRLTFTDEIVAAIDHLLAVDAPYGTYNVSNGGPVTSWAEVARAVYAGRGQDPAAVTEVTAEAYGRGKDLAPRPRHSALDLTKITATGFVPRPAADRLAAYLRDLR